MAAERAGGVGSGSARRRRDRQLRAFRHEPLTVRVKLAAALQHSAQPTGPVVEEPREEAGHETYNSPRAPMPVPPGTRPVPLNRLHHTHHQHHQGLNQVDLRVGLFLCP